MTSSTSRAGTSSQRGFALLAAIVLAVLYFALMELLLIDSSRALQEAQRFKARTVAAALAENGAELAAKGIVTNAVAPRWAEDWQGMIRGSRTVTASGFVIQAEGETSGVIKQKATVRVQGRVAGNQIQIDFTEHSQ